MGLLLRDSLYEETTHFYAIKLYASKPVITLGSPQMAASDLYLGLVNNDQD